MHVKVAAIICRGSVSNSVWMINVKLYILGKICRIISIGLGMQIENTNFHWNVALYYVLGEAIRNSRFQWDAAEKYESDIQMNPKWIVMHHNKPINKLRSIGSGLE